MHHIFSDAYLNGGYKRTVGALRKLGVRQMDQEIASDAWAVAWERRDQLRNQAYLVPWVIKIARNLAKREFRKTNHLEQLAPQHDGTVVAETDVALGIERARVNRLLEYCTPKQRQALDLCCLNDMSAQEAAQVMGTTAEAIAALLTRARHALREVAAVKFVG